MVRAREHSTSRKARCIRRSTASRPLDCSRAMDDGRRSPPPRVPAHETGTHGARTRAQGLEGVLTRGRGRGDVIEAYLDELSCVLGRSGSVDASAARPRRVRGSSAERRRGARALWLTGRAGQPVRRRARSASLPPGCGQRICRARRRGGRLCPVVRRSRLRRAACTRQVVAPGAAHASRRDRGAASRVRRRHSRARADAAARERALPSAELAVINRRTGVAPLVSGLVTVAALAILAFELGETSPTGGSR